MTNFKYGADIGVPSYHEIETFCRRSGIGFSVSSTTGGDHGATSHHYSGNAADLVSSAGSMQSLAQWLYEGYSPYILELIHSGGPGYFVKNGERVSGEFYGAATISQHYNHVHIAMTLSGISAAVGSNPSGTTAGPSTTIGGRSGCAIPTMIGAFLFVLNLWGLVWLVLP